jgi:hypothetical protein
VCDDGIDNDGDLKTDLEDPGCFVPEGPSETTKCEDGIDNDGDGKIDFDGGASVNLGIPLGTADPSCDGLWDNFENEPGQGCGLGAELGVVILGLYAMFQRRRPRLMT